VSLARLDMLAFMREGYIPYLELGECGSEGGVHCTAAMSDVHALSGVHANLSVLGKSGCEYWQLLFK